MERAERELIEQSMGGNFELRKLYEQHREFEARLHKLARQSFLTPAEELEERKLKQLKLKGVERMLYLVGSYSGATP